MSAKTFIVDLNAKSLSIDEIEFEESMQAARETNKLIPEEFFTTQEVMTTSQGQIDPGASARVHHKETNGELQTTNFFCKIY